MIKIVVTGSGYWGKNLVRNFHALGALTGICDKDPRMLQNLQESYYGVEIGGGTKIWHFAHVLSGSSIGENCKIGQNVVIGPDVAIGNGCKIQNKVSVYKGVTLEDEVFCGPFMVFTKPRRTSKKLLQTSTFLVRSENAW